MRIIILAGGKGRRLSPLSNEITPKQFLRISSKETLLKRTVRRFVEMGLARSTYIVTSKQHLERTVAELEDFREEFHHRVIVEPCSKNTGPAIAWCLKELLHTYKEISEKDLIMTVPIDHIVSNDMQFGMELVKVGSQISLHEILSFGTISTRAASCYGYIEKGDCISPGKFFVKKFLEKPSESLALELMNKGCLWNLGIYVFSIKAFLQELCVQQRFLYHLITGSEDGGCLYEKIPSISIDDAIIVHAKNLKVYEIAHLEWFDVGTWDGIYALIQQTQKKAKDSTSAQFELVV